MKLVLPEGFVEWLSSKKEWDTIDNTEPKLRNIHLFDSEFYFSVCGYTNGEKGASIYLCDHRFNIRTHPEITEVYLDALVGEMPPYAFFDRLMELFSE